MNYTARGSFKTLDPCVTAHHDLEMASSALSVANCALLSAATALENANLPELGAHVRLSAGFCAGQATIIRVIREQVKP